jgi:lipopolysaccharide transport system permease protein
MYRQTLLGIFWAFLPPLANTAIWLFLKSQDVFHIGDTGVDSTVFILTGMILWQGFVEAFQIPANQLSSNKNMLSRLNFPRESLVLVGFAEVIFNLLIRGILLAPAFYWFGVPLHSGSLLALGTMILMIFWGMALGLFLMPIGALYKDVGRFIALVLPFWMIVTPLVYVAPPTFPGNLLNWLNPASPLILVSRDLLLLGTTSHQTIGIVFGVLTLPLFILGMMVYRISLPILIERMAA